MSTNQKTGDSLYSLTQVAEQLGKSVGEIELLIRTEKLGFVLTDFGPLISNTHMGDYLLGKKPKFMKDYEPEGPRRKARKWYPKARTHR